MSTQVLQHTNDAHADSERAINVMPTEWSTLSYMSDVRPLDESDLPCLEELRQILAKHARLDRLGITLLHRHFELSADEIMVEEIDFQQRSLIIKPQKKSVVGKCVETMWKLGVGEAEQACAKQHCYSTCIEQEKTFRELLKDSHAFMQSS
jgi:hypothetical protein